MKFTITAWVETDRKKYKYREMHSQLVNLNVLSGYKHKPFKYQFCNYRTLWPCLLPIYHITHKKVEC